MRIIEWENQFRALVSSDSGDTPYTVDLESIHGNGQCDCMDFKTRCSRLIKAGVTHDQLSRCKHIHYLRSVAAYKLLNQTIKARLDRKRNPDGH